MDDNLDLGSMLNIDNYNKA